MSETNSTFPFPGTGADGGLDLNSIFGEVSTDGDVNPFDMPVAAGPIEAAPAPAEIAAEPEPATATSAPEPEAVTTVVETRPEPTAATEPEQPQTADVPTQQPIEVASAPKPESNPIADAFAQQTEKNDQKGLLEKLPVFCHKNVKEPIEDATITFEELRIRKSDDFADLEEGKSVSWTVEYCGIRKEIKDPKGTTIISIKQTIERSREFLDAVRKSKGKTTDCLVKPRVTMKTKGVATYKGNFRTVEEARGSDKAICLIPGRDGRLYEMQKTELGEFIAPKNKVLDFQEIRAGFTPALPLIPLSLIGQILAFFRAFMDSNAKYEALALIYWDKMEHRYFAYIPKQIVSKDHIDADMWDCPYNDETRYILYADIHSHNDMDAFFSPTDDRDERGTGLYLVAGHLDQFFPDIAARISCGGSFVDISPGEVIEGLEGDTPFPQEWLKNVVCKPRDRRLHHTGEEEWK